MRQGRILVTVLAVLSTLSVSSQARDAAGALSDVAVIANESGESRVLFRVSGLALPDRDVAIRRAALRFSLRGDSAARRSQLRVYPVSTEWDAGSVDWETSWRTPGGDFEDDVFARTKVEYSRGAHEVTIDLTGLFKEVYERGREAHGFLVSVAPYEGDGIRSEDLERFQDLGDGQIELLYRESGPRPPGLRDPN